MSNISGVPEELPAGRSDPVYMAHAYLTKVPVPAIMPLIEAYTKPGDLVLDPFAGSGMTGVAAVMLGRRARLSDISVLGQHIGSGYLTLVDPDLFRKHAAHVVRAARDRLGDVYAVPCVKCGQPGELIKTVWSFLVECSGCGSTVNYYRSMEAARWQKSSMRCPNCGAGISSRHRRVSEEPVLDYVSCRCSKKQIEQTADSDRADFDLTGYEYPHVEIGADREMYRVSALAKNGYTTVASFYSPRNLAVLSALHHEICRVPDDKIRKKLLFAFTACLTRASKRYQWSRQRPLNAANANYYVAPVFYEWNVFDLFERKLTAVLRADNWIKQVRRHYAGGEEVGNPPFEYELHSAAKIPLPDDSVDYIFTDPPFGSNLFYADMALFQEGWLGAFTDARQEAVIDRSRNTGRSADRYEELLVQALSEMRRVVKDGNYISMVFGNSSGEVWELVQRAIRKAGLTVVPEALAVLDKGQRSVKGLASGFEHVATLDLVITMTTARVEAPPLREVSDVEVVQRLRHLVDAGQATSPSHLYLELLRIGFREGWLLGRLNLRTVTTTLLEDGWQVDPKTGRLRRAMATRPLPL